MNQLKPLREATRSYVGAHVAHRDARRLLDIGLSAATEDARRLLAVERTTLALVKELVVAQVAMEVIELYSTDPTGHPEGRTVDTALAHARENVRGRYARGRCWFCRGPALECAKRHARGRSCA
jgi:hypothetical protein